jgi:hypothetical protein
LNDLWLKGIASPGRAGSRKRYSNDCANRYQQI